jgi:hypothetical protein
MAKHPYIVVASFAFVAPIALELAKPQPNLTLSVAHWFGSGLFLTALGSFAVWLNRKREHPLGAGLWAVAVMAAVEFLGATHALRPRTENVSAAVTQTGLRSGHEVNS